MTEPKLTIEDVIAAGIELERNMADLMARVAESEAGYAESIAACKNAVAEVEAARAEIDRVARARDVLLSRACLRQQEVIAALDDATLLNALHAHASSDDDPPGSYDAMRAVLVAALSRAFESVS